MEMIKKLCAAVGIPVDLFMMLAMTPEEGVDTQRVSEALLNLLVAAQREEAKRKR
jgi:hypothetical protein